ncbi:hypothetical protein CEXT_533131 [Caerostris extrusa]|uniref:Uncharacterized protein n=1 Tax=Caerostris extrusa TaxID=172846 RepID=A0AAV4MUA4_CAEEX|nr:hypothetical protein CEXT_533131 [Caerostris extrusa]
MDLTKSKADTRAAVHEGQKKYVFTFDLDLERDFSPKSRLRFSTSRKWRDQNVLNPFNVRREFLPKWRKSIHPLRWNGTAILQERKREM